MLHYKSNGRKEIPIPPPEEPATEEAKPAVDMTSQLVTAGVS